MQRIFNLLGLIGFLLSGSMTAALVISFMQMDSIQKQAVQRITGEVTSAVEKELNGMMPSLPTTTDAAVPFLKK